MFYEWSGINCNSDGPSPIELGEVCPGGDYKWFQNLQSDSRSRRDKVINRRNIFNILRIEHLVPTKRLCLRGGFETAFNPLEGSNQVVCYLMGRRGLRNQGVAYLRILLGFCPYFLLCKESYPRLLGPSLDQPIFGRILQHRC